MIRKWLAVGIILLFIGTCIVPFTPLCSAESDDYYFEDVNVLITGRCRHIGSNGTWIGGFFIGTQPYPGVEVSDTRFEKLRVTIFNKTILNPWISLSGLVNSLVFMHNAKGIFFWSCWEQFSARLIPPIVFVFCHAENVWIYR